MSEKSWGATGVGKLQPFFFNEGDRKEILPKIGRDIDFIPENLIAALEYSLVRYKSNKLLAEESKPKAVKANLNRAQRAAEKLSGLLGKLDGNSIQLIGTNGNLIQHRENLAALIGQLKRARNLADGYPGKSSGRPVDSHRIWLIIDVADVLNEFLSIVSAIDTTFLSILEIAYKNATNKKIANIGITAKSALENRSQYKIVHPNGMIEYFIKT